MAANTIISTGLSGLLASQRRLQTAAENIVNARSAGDEATAFRPRRSSTLAVPGGGVRAVTAPIVPPFTPAFAPNHPGADADGTVLFPNVSLARELVEMKTAARAYEASLRLVESGDDLDDALLDAFDSSRR